MTNPDNIITLLQDEIVYLRAYIQRLEAIITQQQTIPRVPTSPPVPPPPPLQRQTGTYLRQ